MRVHKKNPTFYDSFRTNFMLHFVPYFHSCYLSGSGFISSHMPFHVLCKALWNCLFCVKSSTLINPPVPWLGVKCLWTYKQIQRRGYASGGGEEGALWHSDPNLLVRTLKMHGEVWLLTPAGHRRVIIKAGNCEIPPSVFRWEEEIIGQRPRWRKSWQRAKSSRESCQPNKHVNMKYEKKYIYFFFVRTDNVLGNQSWTHTIPCCKFWQNVN